MTAKHSYTAGDIPGLLAALHSGDETLRRAALATLERLQPTDEEIVVDLLSLVAHPDEFVRRGVVWLLGDIGSPLALPALQRALQDENEEVRWVAVQSMGRVYDASIEELITRLRRTDNPQQAKAIQNALDTIRETTLTSLLDAVQQGDWATRIVAAMRLATTLDRRAVESLIWLLQSDDATTRRVSVAALAETGSPLAWGPLNALLNDPEPLVALEAARALRCIKR